MNSEPLSTEGSRITSRIAAIIDAMAMCEVWAESMCSKTAAAKITGICRWQQGAGEVLPRYLRHNCFVAHRSHDDQLVTLAES